MNSMPTEHPTVETILAGQEPAPLVSGHDLELPCPTCGEDGRLFINLDQLDIMACHECGEEWSAGDLEEEAEKFLKGAKFLRRLCGG